MVITFLTISHKFISGIIICCSILYTRNDFSFRQPDKPIRRRIKMAIRSPLTCYPLRLKPGEEVKSTLSKFVKDNNLSAAFILTTVGSVTKATLRYSNSTTIETLGGPFEIVSLVGTLSQEGGHLHITLSDKTGVTCGGHVVGDLIVHTTAEIMLANCTDLLFKRQYDASTGYPELVIQKK